MSDSQSTTIIQQSHRSVGTRLGCLLGRHSGRHLGWLAAGAVAVLLSASPAAASCPGGIMMGDGTSGAPCEITDRGELEEMANGLGLSYELMNDLDLAGTDWTPIGTNSGPFTGTFDGNDYTISNMTIDLPSVDDVGLFGVADNAAISNLKLVDAAVTGDESVGALVGELRNTSSVSQSSATGNVTGGEVVGGLVGRMSSSSISSSFATGAVVSTTSSAGGLLGGGQGSSQIVNSYATGAVTTDNQAGGLVGFVADGYIANSYATGLATATGEGYAAAGGLVGWFDGVGISNSFATGEVRGNDGDGVGGLVGWLETSSEISKSYAIGLIGVSGVDDYFGGLVGYIGDTNRTNVTDSFWNTATSGQATSAGGTGKTTTELKTLSTFTDAGWDFVGETTNGESDIWKVTQGNTVSYPYLDGFDYDEPDAEPAVNPIPGLTGPLYAGGSGTETSPYQITNWQQLHNMRFNLGANFVLNNNLDENTGGYTTYVKDGETLANGGTGWTPIGDATNQFTGAFDGDGYTISNMTVSRAGLDYAGLFGYTDGASITDLTLSDIDVLGAGYVGGLVGRANDTTLSGINIVGSTSLVASDVDGDARIGGIVGLLQGASGLDASESYAQVSAPTGNRVGGAAGEVVDSAASLDILEVVVYGDVTGQYRVGGLVGYANQNTNIEGSSIRDAIVSGRGSVGGAAGYSANAPVNLDDVVVLNTQVTASDSDEDGSGYSDVGGLIGSAYNTTIVKSVASGVTVEGAGRNIGGAIGYLAAESTLTESYVTGSVVMTGTGTQGGVGGLVGSAVSNSAATVANNDAIKIIDSYTLADVSVPSGANTTGGRGVGGLIGYKNNEILVERAYAAGIIDGQNDNQTGGFIGTSSDPTSTNEVWFDKTISPGLSDESSFGKSSEELRDSSLFSGQTAWTSATAGAGTATAGFDYGAMPYLANVTLEDDKDTSLFLFAGGWGGLTSTEQAGADGSPYVITNWNELQNINLVVDQGYEFVLANDLTASTEGYAGQVKKGSVLANSLEGWEPLGDDYSAFEGTLDGQGFAINDLAIDTDSEDAGLFGLMAAGEIKNLTLTNPSLETSEPEAGVLVGRVEVDDDASVVINNVDLIAPVVTSTVTSDDAYVGGLIGTVETGTGNQGQVTVSNIEIRDLVLTAADERVGGLAGRMVAGSDTDLNILVENVLVVEPDITASNDYVGGLIGATENKGNGTTTLRQLTIRDGVINSGGAEYVGGLLGRLQDKSAVVDAVELINPTITSTRNGTAYIGGMIGRVGSFPSGTGQLNITDIEITGLTLSVPDGEYVGGLLGHLEADANEVMAIAVERVMLIEPEVTGGNDYVGGIAGFVRNDDGQTTLRQLSVRGGDIDGGTSKYVGGLIGRLMKNSLLDERNAFTGTVKGGHSVGGLIGRLSENSVVNFGYVEAEVTGRVIDGTTSQALAGLIAGYTSTNDQVVTEIYAVGSVSHNTAGATGLGVIGRVGSSGDRFEDIYYHSTSGSISFSGALENGAPTIINATELTAQQMQGAEARVNMKGIADTSRWDFGENWIANENDYPIFRWEADEFDIAVTEPEVFAVGDGSASTPFQIATWTDLQNISLVANEGHHFILMNDLDATSTGYDSEVKDGQVLANGQVGWKPIGRWISSSDFSKAFNGTFDGQNNTISGLRFERDDAANLGLFAAINDATIKNLTLTDAELIATGTTSQVSHVALLAAHAGTFEIDNVSITGEVSVKTSLDDLNNDYELRHIAGVIAEAHVSGTQQAPNAIKNSDFDVTVGVELAADPNPNVRYLGGVFGGADEDFFAIEATSITGQIDIAPSSASTVRGGNIQDVGLIVGLAEDDWSLVNSEITGNINLSQVGNVNRVALGFGETGNRGQVTNANVTGELNLIDVARVVNVALFAGKSNSDWVLDETALDGVITVESNDYIRDGGLLLGERGAWTVDNSIIEGAMSLTTTSTSSAAIQEIGGLAGDPGSGWVVSNTPVDGTLTLSAPNGGVLEVSLGAANSLGAWALTNVNFTGAIDITAGGRVDDVGLVAAGTRGDWSLSEVGAVGDILITAGDGVADVGGLIGYRSPSSNTGDYTIETSYTQGEIRIDAQGDVANVGGLLGEIVLSDPNCCDVGTDMAFNITNAYSTMDIGIESTGAVSRVGGLIGNGAEAVFSDQVVELNLTRTYYAGLFDVPADATDAGGLIGRYEDTDLTVTGGYWDGTLSPLTNNKGGEAKTSAEIRSFATFDAGWNQGGLNIVDGWQAPNNPSWGMCPSAQDGLAFLLWQYDQNPCLPDAPTDLVATAGNGEVSIAFTEANGFGVVIGNYRYSLDAGASWVAFNPVVTGSPVVVPGLVNGTSYSIILRAISSVGEGEASEAITATPKTVPAAPSNLTATAGNGEVVIGFDAGNNGGDPISNYEYSLDAGDTWTAFNPAVTTSPLTLAGLANGTEYSIVLRALNGAGAGAVSEAVSATPKTVPAAPTNLSATAGNAEVVIGFVAGDNGGAAITNYEYSVDAGNTWIAFDPAVTGSPVTVPDLANGTAYSIVLRAVNGVGTSLASEAVVAQPEIPAPTVSASNVQVTELAGRVLVEWEAPLIDDVVPVTGYRVLIDGEVACTVAATDPLSCAFDDLDPEVAYEISVVVLTDGGIGPQVTEPDVSPLPVIPIPSLSLPSLLLLGLMMLGLGVLGSRRRSIGAC